jgi:MoxR-like ATPase
MQEQQVTIEGEALQLAKPYLVMATQNPIEQEGTYPLPEAQVDRFMLKVIVDYPRPNEERMIIDRMTGGPLPAVRPVVSPEQILRAREMVRSVYVDDKIKNYVLDLVLTTRDPGTNGLSDLRPFVAFGASPRAGINLVLAGRAHAFINGRGFVTPDDIKAVAPDVLRHRVIVSYEAEAENVSSADIVQRILDYAEVP